MTHKISFHANRLSFPFFTWLTAKLRDLFRLEEVEVTFSDRGYTYTKVSHH